MEDPARTLLKFKNVAQRALNLVPNLIPKRGLQAPEQSNSDEVIQALVSRKVWLRSVLDNTGVGTAVIDLTSSVIVEACHALSKMLGYVPDGLIKTRFVDLIAPEHRKLHLEGLQSLCSDFCSDKGGSNKGLFKQEIQCLRQDGVCIWIQLTVLACTPGYSSKHATFVIEDIEEKKSAQLVTEKQALELQLNVDNLSVGAVHISRTSGPSEDPLVFLNPLAQRLLGFSTEDVQTLGALFGALYRDNSLQASIEYEEARLQKVRAPTTIEIFCKDGRKKLLDVAWSIHSHGEVWILHDATDRQSANEKFQKMFELSRDPYLIISTDRILECNEAAVEILGMQSKAEILQLGLDDINPPFQPDGRRSETVVRERWEEVVEKGQCTFEWTHKKKDGTTFLVEVHVTTCKLEGQTVLMTVWHDLAAQKESEAELKAAKEAAEESSRIKSQFLSNCSHEIRTPMNGVIGITDILLQTELAPLQRNYIEILRSSGETLMTLINDILDLSKIEAESLRLESIPFGVRDLVDSAKALLEPAARTKGISLTTKIGTMVPGEVVGDPARLRQVIMNLVGNSIKFTERGSVQIIVSVLAPARSLEGNTLKRNPSQQDVERAVARKSQEAVQEIRLDAIEGCLEYRPDVAVAFEVRDTGIGIPVEAQGKLFGAFVQADPSTSRRYGGSGLGLCICKSLVNLMGGDIKLTSNAGVGSSFSFSIPLESVNVDCAQQNDLLPSANGGRPSWDEGRLQTNEARSNSTSVINSGGTTAPDGRSRSQLYLHVLVAEDNRVNQIVATRILQNLGCTYDVAEDGCKAVQLARERSYDLILMDCHMPEMDGYEATRAIRRLEELGMIRIPIIAVTAAVLSDDVRKCREAGMDSILSKPFRQSDLANAILSCRECLS